MSRGAGPLARGATSLVCSVDTLVHDVYALAPAIDVLAHRTLAQGVDPLVRDAFTMACYVATLSRDVLTVARCADALTLGVPMFRILLILIR